MSGHGTKKLLYVANGIVLGYGVRLCSFDPENHDLNIFLGAFHIWGSKGEERSSDPKSNSFGSTLEYFEPDERWFEFSPDMYEFCHSELFYHAVEKFGVKVIHEWPISNNEFREEYN